MSLMGRLTAFFPGARRPLVVSLLLWGILTTVVVPITNGVYDLEVGSASWWLSLVATLGALAGLYASRTWASDRLLSAHARQMSTLWEQTGEALLRSDVAVVARQPGLRAQLSGDLGVVGGSIQSLFFLVQSGAVLAASTFVVLFVDGKAALIWCATFGAVALAVRPALKSGPAARGVAAARRAELNLATQDLVAGLVASRMDRAVGDAVGGRVLDAAEACLSASRGAALRTEDSFQNGIVLLYLVGFLPAAFSDPQAVGADSQAAFALVLMLSQGLGPTFGLMHSLPHLFTFLEASSRIEASLSSLKEDASPDAPLSSAWRTLRLRDLRFSYGNGFGLGPLDLELSQGELVFVTGGNGSGKSTLMRSLLGLQGAQGGWIEWDGQVVTRPLLPAYRQLFTALFNEVHLFDRLYGVPAKAEAASALLARLGLQGVVELDGDTFSTLSLSTGQRKRLAMVVALLEDRPICVFDEWTANLDPQTTRFYYDELLPELLRRGKTVVAVSHDDRYFDRADRLLVMENGKIVSDVRRAREGGGPPASPSEPADPAPVGVSLGEPDGDIGEPA